MLRPISVSCGQLFVARAYVRDGSISDLCSLALGADGLVRWSLFSPLVVLHGPVRAVVSVVPHLHTKSAARRPVATVLHTAHPAQQALSDQTTGPSGASPPRKDQTQTERLRRLPGRTTSARRPRVGQSSRSLWRRVGEGGAGTCPGSQPTKDNHRLPPDLRSSCTRRGCQRDRSARLRMCPWSR